MDGWGDASLWQRGTACCAEPTFWAMLFSCLTATVPALLHPSHPAEDAEDLQALFAEHHAQEWIPRAAAAWGYSEGGLAVGGGWGSRVVGEGGGARGLSWHLARLSLGAAACRPPAPLAALRPSPPTCYPATPLHPLVCRPGPPVLPAVGGRRARGRPAQRVSGPSGRCRQAGVAQGADVLWWSQGLGVWLALGWWGWQLGLAFEKQHWVSVHLQP